MAVIFNEDNSLQLSSDNDKQVFTSYIVTGFIGGLVLTLFYEGNPFEHSLWTTFIIHPMRTLALMIATAPLCHLMVVLYYRRNDNIAVFKKNYAVNSTVQLLVRKPRIDLSSSILGAVEKSVSHHPTRLMILVALLVLLPGAMHWSFVFANWGDSNPSLARELETWKYIPTCGTIGIFIFLDWLRNRRSSGEMLLSFRSYHSDDARSHFVEEFPTDETPKVRRK